ncbi:hypothetical protein COBT_002523, partial [Conglomerata obtusa]
ERRCMQGKNIITENIWFIGSRATDDILYMMFIVISTHNILENLTSNQNNIIITCVSAYIQDDKNVALIARYIYIEHNYNMLMDIKEKNTRFLKDELDRNYFIIS